MPIYNRNREGLERDAHWYQSGVIYEVHVRAFFDTDADGAGDFVGLTEKLDYIKDLGVTAVWLLPFYPSPLKDDGYDIADYCDVHRMYGTLSHFKTFLREAHRRGLRVVTELVLNHTSDQHPWFQRARHAPPGSRWRNYYVWSDTPDKYKEARIIFKDVELSNWTWDHVAKAYYWHRFFSHQPDLNYDNPEVHEKIIKVVDFWLDLGVDGLRLDAVPYLYERESSNCENLPDTHIFLKTLRAHVDQNYEDRMLLAEANQWPEDAVAYFGQGRGDECHMAYHFPLMPRLFMSLRMEDRLPIVDILEQTPPIPETSQWALFLRNHDELTLEMVTDEERDYMYRMYAHVHHARLNLGIRRRLAPLLNDDRKSIELLNALLFSLPGTPVLYYGDEIGLGENIYLGDRNGVRTPMQWSSDKNAGFSRANPQSLYLPIILDPSYHYEACNVEAQLANPHSLLWWMRRLLALRKRWRALGEGKCEFLQPENRRILCYVLRYQQEIILVVANLSRFVQPVELDLSAFKQYVPVELFGRTEFPAITDQPYFLTLGPHNFYWFSLELKPDQGQIQSADGAPARRHSLMVTERWQELLAGKGRTELEAVLPDYLRHQHWFAGRPRTIKTLTLREVISVPLKGDETACLAFVQVDYVGGGSELYSLPLAFALGPEAERIHQNAPSLVVADLTILANGQSGVLYDALGSATFGKALLGLILHRQRVRSAHGEIEGSRLPILRRTLGQAALPDPILVRAEQDNSSLLFGDKFILKHFRRLEIGLNPELEIGQFLGEKEFTHCPPLAGNLEYVRADDQRTTLAVVHVYLPNTKSAWDYTMDTLSRYYDRVISWVAQGAAAPAPPAEPIRFLQQDIPPDIVERIGTYMETARLLGARTAELHLALASETDIEGLKPEPLTGFYQRSLFQSMRTTVVQTLRQLRKQLKNLPPDILPLAQQVTELEPTVIHYYQQFAERRFAAQRIHIHGDFHLGQALWTGRNFVFIDFEGEPAMPLSERWIKRSPLRDVASFVRSFHYAAYAGLHQHVERGAIPQDNLAPFESWVRLWNVWVSVAYLKAYLLNLDGGGLLPHKGEDLWIMLQAYLLHHVVRELAQELGADTGRLRIPLQGILYLVGEPAASPVSPFETGAHGGGKDAASRAAQ